MRAPLAADAVVSLTPWVVLDPLFSALLAGRSRGRGRAA
jgi:hypothetical protein